MAGYTQEDLSKKIFMHRTVYTLKENGDRQFTDDEKKLLFNVLKKRLPSLKREDVFPIE